MQNPIFEPTNLPELPQPTFFEHWFLESSLPTSLGAIALGILLFGVSRSIPQLSKLKLPVLIISLLLGISIYALGHFTQTDREILESHTRELVRAVNTQDTQTLESMFDDQIEIRASFYRQTGKQTIINTLMSQSSRAFESVETREINAGLFGERVARTQLKVKVSGDTTPPLSWWQIDWTRSSNDTDQWTITDIEPIWIQGFSNP